MWIFDGRAVPGAYQSVSAGVFSRIFLSHSAYLQGFERAVCQLATIATSPLWAGFSSAGWIVTGWSGPRGM